MDVSQSGPIRATLAGAIPRSAADQFSPETEARKLLEIMGDTGVLAKDYVDGILGRSKELSAVIEAEVVVDDELDELESNK